MANKNKRKRNINEDEQYIISFSDLNKLLNLFSTNSWVLKSVYVPNNISSDINDGYFEETVSILTDDDNSEYYKLPMPVFIFNKEIELTVKSNRGTTKKAIVILDIDTYNGNYTFFVEGYNGLTSNESYYDALEYVFEEIELDLTRMLKEQGFVYITKKYNS